MATLADILAAKGPKVTAIAPGATVLEAAVLMNEHKIGSVVVCEKGRVRGIFTERDILRRVVVPRRDPSQTEVREVMTGEVACGRPYTTIEEARGVMKNRRFRHLPDRRRFRLIVRPGVHRRPECPRDQQQRDDDPLAARIHPRACRSAALPVSESRKFTSPGRSARACSNRRPSRSQAAPSIASWKMTKMRCPNTRGACPRLGATPSCRLRRRPRC